jgi:hypothetical protein
MHLKDWTNRKGGGLGLLAAALGFAVPAYLSQSTLYSAIAAFLAMAGITFLGIDFWSRRKVALSVEAFTDYLSHILSTPKNLFIAGFEKRKFAVLKVTNTGSKNLKHIIAGCRFNQGAEERGIWSLDSGDYFTAGGSHRADLDVGDSRLLVVAQGFGADKLWARLPGQQPFGWPPRGTNFDGGVAYVGVSGTLLSIASDAVITARFVAEDLHPLVRHFRLDFDGDEPRITPLKRVPWHRCETRRQTRQLSAIERLHEWERNVDQMQIEAWDDFFMAAGETVSQFRAMRGGESPPPAQKWETFKRTAGHASRSATHLPEPYNEQARVLIQFFLDLEQANLESCVAAANELQSFILKRQAGVQPDPPAGVL